MFSSYSKFLLCTISSSFKLVSLRWKVFYGTWDKNSKKYNKVEFEGMNVLAKGGQIWWSISIFIFPIYVYNNSRPLLIIRNIICSVYVVLCILIIFRMFEKRFDISWKTKSPFFLVLNSGCNGPFRMKKNLSYCRQKKKSFLETLK